MSLPAHESPAGQRPLVVDLDGTLIRSDLLVELVFAFLGRSPQAVFKLPLWLWSGRAVLKRRLAETIPLDVTALPYDEAVLERVRAAREEGRAVYLASASDARLVAAVAAHLGLFDGWFASDGATNLAGPVKAARLVAAFGAGNFDYVGNGRADLAVWERCGTAIAAGASPRLERRLARLTPAPERIESVRRAGAWLRLLRPEQWAKNLLVGVPVLTAHQFTPASVLLALLAMIAFSACASSVYILNDLVDIQADRAHPRKRERPFARGDVSFVSAAALGAACLLVAFAIAALVSRDFLVVLAAYLALTTAYSLFLKRKMLIDAVTLAVLYTIRVVAGAVAIGVPMSEWLLAFSMFIFLSLALVKRYSELALRFDAGLPDPAHRDYRVDDLSVVASLAAASGYCAVIVLALYISSDTVRALYTRPFMLWLACPVLLYWISRILMLSHRRVLHDDPVIFALKDPVSLATAAIVLLLALAAA